ncbi:MAG: VanZ family protein [Thermoanaerobaculaceae bacterium]|nr:VanZ family protein [Thermoanaerobaculaceae bacterium]MDI9622049.1 VanZ family protein [Acidobacteriota bacterium]NLH12787.1 VanZ family protein [Holophagae bacterium]HPW54839.1 VanZ family protein [Thermoanaerobaculaceae bacterium]
MRSGRAAVAWLLAAIALSTAFVIAGVQPRVPSLLRPVPDDLLHGAAYLVLAFAVAQAGRLWGLRAWALLALAWAVLHGAGLEVLQQYFPPRAAEWSDLGADAVGALVGAGAAWVWSRVRR